MTSHPRRRRAAVAALAFGGLSAAATPAQADTARHTGWHTVCAQDRTVYDNGPVTVLHNGDQFHIDHFAGSHAWGWGHDLTSGVERYGWVTNGYFCRDPGPPAARRRAIRARAASASSSRARSGVGAVPPRRTGSHQVSSGPGLSG